MTNINFMTLLWLFAILAVLHEAEEWSITGWIKRNFVDLPPFTDKDTHFGLIFISLVLFVWCAVAILLGNPSLAAWMILPVVAATFLNTLQHFYWQFRFRQEYAPGIITAVLLIPLASEITIQAVQQNYIPVWFVGILLLLIVLGTIQTVKAKNTFVPQLQALLVFSAKAMEKLSPK